MEMGVSFRLTNLQRVEKSQIEEYLDFMVDQG
jgi:hypothetical protein